MNALVSIIIPFFNAQNTLRATIDSVLKQSHPYIQILLINDGSTDDSTTVAKEYTDSRIQYLEQENSGVSVARNYGLSHSKGDFVCFLDADDLITENAITMRLELFRQNPQLGIVGGSQIEMDFNLKNVLQIQVPLFRGNPKKELIRLNSNCFINCGTWLIRKDIIGSHRFPVGWTHAEDLGFFYLISKNTHLDFTKEPVQIYRRLSESAMSNLDGLLQGYLNYIKLIQSNKEDSLDLFILKFKSSKIMFLSFLSKKNIFKAFRATLRIWLA